MWPHEVEPHEVEPWFHSWYRGRVETLDANSYLGNSLLTVSVATWSGAMVSFMSYVG